MSVKKIGLSILVIVFAILIFLLPKINTVYHAMHLFDKDKITENFRTMGEKWPASVLEKSSSPYVYKQGSKIELPKSFTFQNEEVNTKQFLDSSFATGFIVIQNDSILYENYFRGNTETTTTISWSLAKSFISALMGIAIDEGHILTEMENVEDYVPELKGTAYEGVTIKEVLQMSTGVKFNEDYGSFSSDINRWGRGFAFGRSQDKFAASLERDKEPGTYNHYVSINTHVLGMIIKRATGKTITEYMQEELWEPAGMENNAYWLMDGKGMEMVLGGLNATLRDYAKGGSIYLHNGFWNGKQIVPKEWVKISSTPDAPHLKPGENPLSAHTLGYGYQWWIPESDQGEFIALGVYNQNIYVNPTTNTVIAKTSANPYYNDKSKITSLTEAHIALYRSIIEHANKPKKLLVESLPEILN